jgi:hypothetical protein
MHAGAAHFTSAVQFGMTLEKLGIGLVPFTYGFVENP